MDRVFFIIIFLISFIELNTLGRISKNDLSVFSGRVSSFHLEAKIIKFKLNFANIRYLSKGNKVKFWTEYQNNYQCQGIVLVRSSFHILVKVSKISQCNSLSPFVVGKYYFFGSKDLRNNIETGKDLIKILLKKKIALRGKIKQKNKMNETFLNKEDAVNNRYEILKKKLELERMKKLGELKIDQENILKSIENLDERLNAVNVKLEKYRVDDKNLIEDRWSIDPSYHYFK